MQWSDLPIFQGLEAENHTSRFPAVVHNVPRGPVGTGLAPLGTQWMAQVFRTGGRQVWDLLFGEWNGLKQAGQRRSPVIVVRPKMRRSEVRLGVEWRSFQRAVTGGHRPGEGLAEAQVATLLTYQ